MSTVCHHSSFISALLQTYFPPLFKNMASSKPLNLIASATPTSRMDLDGSFLPLVQSRNLIYIDRTSEQHSLAAAYHNALSVYRLQIGVDHSSHIHQELDRNPFILVLDSGTSCVTALCLWTKLSNSWSVITNFSAFFLAPGPAFSPPISKHWKTCSANKIKL